MSVTAGVVGLGFGEKIHVPGLRRAGAEVVAVCARHGAEEAAARLDVPSAHTDWRELVGDDRVQLVSIASPPATHHAIALAALAAGKAVLCEKPLAVTLAEAVELAAAARLAAAPTLVDFEFRAVPAFARAKELLDEGALGSVHTADVRWLLPPRPRSGPAWKDDRALGGGQLLNLGVHAFDYLDWYVGPVARVRGTLEYGGDGPETGCEAAIELRSGATARVVLSAASEHPEGHVIRIDGDHGALVVENRDLTDYMRSFRLELTGARHDTLEPEPTDEDGRLAPFAALAKRLVDAVETDAKAVPSFEEGLRAQRIADAVETSHRTGAWVSVDPEPQV